MDTARRTFIVAGQRKQARYRKALQNAIWVDPWDVFFTQDTIFDTFSNGTRVEDTIHDLRHGHISSDKIALMRVLKWTEEEISEWYSTELHFRAVSESEDRMHRYVCLAPPTSSQLIVNRASGGIPVAGRWYTIDNRRLYAFREAGCRSVMVEDVSDVPTLKIEFAQKYTSTTGGRDVLVVPRNEVRMFGYQLSSRVASTIWDRDDLGWRRSPCREAVSIAYTQVKQDPLTMRHWDRQREREENHFRIETSTLASTGSREEAGFAAENMAKSTDVETPHQREESVSACQRTLASANSSSDMPRRRIDRKSSEVRCCIL
ncbi:hypothetical protein HK102_003075 [Quaeritorhiza haematococci]|nr:hypothetical protein HK102_003075 [Quaeritorhiza haematococci]